jgi:hypothetical protein
MNRCVIAAMLPALGALMTARADGPLPPGFDPRRHMRVSEVKDGMKGYGLSVFKGTKIERFDVEVVSVLRNFNPQHDVVLVTCKGANLEHTAPVAGMSGSPVFLRDDAGRERMIGAFAFSWPLVKDAVGGVQPIEYMLGIPAPAKAAPGPSGTRAAASGLHWSLRDMMGMCSSMGLRIEGSAPGADTGWGADRRAPALRRLTTPLMTRGISRELLAQLEPVFSAYGMMPLQAGGAGADPGRTGPPARLQPGAVMAVPMLSGDADITAIGTVTEVLGDRVLAFGHPLLSEGEVSLPMGSGYIHGVVANLMNSFKLGSVTGVQGALHADHSVGIAGQIGPMPATIPIEVRCVYVDGTLDQTFKFQAAQHPRFTPLLASMAAMVAMTANRELPQYHTLEYDVRLEFGDDQLLRIQNRAVNTSAAELFLAIGQPAMAACENPFERVSLKRVSATMKVSREARQAEILSVSVPRGKYRPGETLKAFVTHRPFREAEAILPLEFELPRDLPDGAYDFAVLDWQQHLAEEQLARAFRFNAESVSDVFGVLRDLAGIRHDAIYMRLLRQPDGVAIGRTAMPRLPSSRRQVLMGAGLSNTTLFVSSTVKAVPTDYVMSGEAHFTLTIDKDAKVESATRPPRHETPAAPPTPKTDDLRPKSPAKPGTPVPGGLEPAG